MLLTYTRPSQRCIVSFFQHNFKRAATSLIARKLAPQPLVGTRFLPENLQPYPIPALAPASVLMTGLAHKMMHSVEHENNNKRWLHRLNLVTTLSEWTEANLSPTHIVWDGQERDKKRSKQGRFLKASQYVYAHLMIGRMLYPCVSEDPYADDPLFALEEYPNESMQLQLSPGLYPDFQAQVQQARKRVMNPGALALIPTVTWEMVLRRVKSQQIVSKLRVFAAESNRPLHVIIGLVLRYLCVGGVDDNLHASITQSGAAAPWARIAWSALRPRLTTSLPLTSPSLRRIVHLEVKAISSRPSRRITAYCPAVSSDLK